MAGVSGGAISSFPCIEYRAGVVASGIERSVSDSEDRLDEIPNGATDGTSSRRPSGIPSATEIPTRRKTSQSSEEFLSASDSG